LGKQQSEGKGMRRIGFIGTGHIAAPMVRTLARDDHALWISERNREVSAELAAAFPQITVAPNQAVLDAVDVVFLCLRPQHAAEGLAPLRFRREQQIVSVMAGVAMAELETFCAPATRICQTIPLGYLEQGGCPLPVYPDGDTLTPLFGGANPILPVPSEAALNQHFAICAFVPGVLDLMATAAGWLTERTGDARGAAAYTSQLLNGFLTAMPKDQLGRLEAERDALATPGSLSLQMTEGLRAGGAHDALTETLDAIGARLEPGA
jgi:pyrroline-5-carboxylate reductase